MVGRLGSLGETEKPPDEAFAFVVGRLGTALTMRPEPQEGATALHWWQLLVEECVRHALALLALERFREMGTRYRSTLRGSELMGEFKALREQALVAINAEARGLQHL